MNRARLINLLAAVAAGVFMPLAAHAAGFQVLYSFKGYPDGSAPLGALIAHGKGNFYGATGSGGHSNLGTIFVLSNTGVETILYSFAGGSDGSVPSAGGLLVGRKGKLFGTTVTGGNTDYCGQGTGCGTVFEFTAGGEEKVLHAFTGGQDGGTPNAPLVADLSGNLYGTTSAGGSTNCGNTYGCGTVFKITRKGNEKILYSFQGGSDGESPDAGLIIDANGNLYGTTGFGGAGCNCGTVFKVTPEGKESVLYAFTGVSSGELPLAGLVADATGILYGTTYLGGGSGCGGRGCGTVFKLAPDGSETVLYAFQGGNDGMYPASSLILDPKGTLYGTTVNGGSTDYCNTQPIGCGTVFAVKADGSEQILHAFSGQDGAFPYGALLMKNGTLYGAASGDGANFNGNVYELPK